jgi:hypothetical protein
MKKLQSIFLIFLGITLGLNAQPTTRIGSEIISKKKFGIGSLEAAIANSNNNCISNKPTYFGFEITKDTIKAVYQNDFNYSENKTTSAKQFKNLKIKWTSNSILLETENELVLSQSYDSTIFPKELKLIATIWQSCNSNLLDTTLAEIDFIKFTNDSNTWEENFDKNTSINWEKSTQKYSESFSKNDTTLIVADKGNIQLISLAFKNKSTKGFFKRNPNESKQAKIINAKYIAQNKPMIVLNFSDSIYLPDKHIKNFNITNNNIKKTKIKNDYKTVCLSLEKKITTKSKLVYMPIIGRYRRPQSFEIE